MEQQQALANDRDWWTSVEEDYWRVLLEQGEVVPDTVPPAEPHEVFDAFGVEPTIESLEGTPATGGNNDPDTEEMWQAARLALDRGEKFDLRALGANRGGLLVDWNGLQGFLPASHLNEMPRYQDPNDRASELADRVGDLVTVCLIEVDPRQSQLVFSEREAVRPAHEPSDVLLSLRPGDTCQGRVTNLTTFGAFVDLGGIEGLIHISELSWERVRHPSDVLSPGQPVEVYVLGVNPDEQRIALSVKRLCPDPWLHVGSRYEIGQLVEGTVTNVVSFGAFVRIEEGLEGLIHISELADGNFLHPRNVVREGEDVQVRVLNIHAAKHRMGLSLRQARNVGRDAFV